MSLEGKMFDIGCFMFHLLSLCTSAYSSSLLFLCDSSSVMLHAMCGISVMSFILLWSLVYSLCVKLLNHVVVGLKIIGCDIQHNK